MLRLATNGLLTHDAEPGQGVDLQQTRQSTHHKHALRQTNTADGVRGCLEKQKLG